MPFCLFPCVFMPLPFTTLIPFFFFFHSLFDDVSAFRSVLESWQSWNRTISLEKKVKIDRVWSFDDHIPVDSCLQPCCVSAFPNDSSRFLPFYFTWNFRAEWARVMFISRCVTSKWSNIFKLSARPCRLSQQYQEVELYKVTLSPGSRPWRPGSIFILGVRRAEWLRAESLWRGQAIYRHKALNKWKPTKHKAPKFWNFGN